MLDSVVIDVVIALTLIFLVFSLITSGLRELVARTFETRSKELWRSLRGLLEDPISSGLRGLRSFAGSQDRETRESLLVAISAAEAALRDAVSSGATSEQWRAAVDAAVAPVTDAAAARGLEREVSPLVAAAVRRLWLEYRTGRRTLLGIVRAGRRGGERPVVPELPTPVRVAELAAAVRRRTMTLTDAVNEHPLIRQVDKTWPGFHSRLRQISSGDFSTALVDLVRAAGVEPAVKSGLVEVGRAIDALPLTDDDKETVWGPIGSGFDEVESLLAAGTATLPDFDALVARIDRSVLDQAAALRLSPPELAAVRDRIAEVHQLIVELHHDPLRLVRVGADALADASPVKNVLERLVAHARRLDDDVWSSLETLRTSLAGWYDSRMAALSAWYRKRSRFVAFGLGLLVVVGFNVDAIGIPQELWQNENVRGVVVAVADTAVVDLEACRASGDQLTCVEGTVDELIDIGLPLGWDVGTSCDGECDGILERISYALGTQGGGVRGALRKVLGWGLAAAALAMGASFWYDVLTRATGFKRSSRRTDTA